MKTSLRLIVVAFGLAIFNIAAGTLYVSLESTNPVPPFTTWATAATNIQDAVDAAKDGDTVLVSNGVYQVGQRTTTTTNDFGELERNRVAITNSIQLESLNGPLVTIIDGQGMFDEYGGATSGVRCVFLGTKAVLSGFTLMNGYMAGAGGGARCLTGESVITNCIFKGNRALSPERYGGGAGGVLGGTLYNCTLSGNSAGAGQGGGAVDSTLYACKLNGNWANYGGGAAYSTLFNCMVISNLATWVGGVASCTLSNCTLSDNSSVRGGGAGSSTLYNCVLSHNVATGGYRQVGGEGGGAVGCALYNCWLVNNLAEPNDAGTSAGGGASYSVVYNSVLRGNVAYSMGGAVDGSSLCSCTLTENSASDGGGVSRSSLYNCIVYYNTAVAEANYDSSSILNYCCTTPIPTNGVGNITGPPLFIDLEAADFRLWEGSPCIDAGTNLLGFPIQEWGFLWCPLLCYYIGRITDPTDILGNTRFIDGNGDGKVAWDIGAYEFNSFRPPRFSSPPQLTTDGWKLNITGAPSKWIRVQKSSNLRDWEDCWSGFMGAEGVKEVTDGDMGQRVMCYRAVVPQ